MEGAMREMQGGILDGYKISPRCLLIGEMYGWGVGDFFSWMGKISIVS